MSLVYHFFLNENFHKQGCSVPIFPKDVNLVSHKKFIDTVFLQNLSIRETDEKREKKIVSQKLWNFKDVYQLNREKILTKEKSL